MRKVLFNMVAFLALLVGARTSASAQTYQALQGYCERGGEVVVTDGRSSTTKVQRSYPSCTITVYDTGTTNLATIATNSGGTPKANPFTADNDGYFKFYVQDGTYDIRYSGSGIPTPFTRSGYWVASGNGGGGSGITGSGTLNRIPVFTGTTSIGNSILEQTGTSEIGFAATGKRLNLDTGSQLVIEMPNATVTGTTSNYLARLTGSPSTAIVAQTSTIDGIIGIVVADAGTTGNAQIATQGTAPCVFDGATTAGHYVVPSTVTGGQCHSYGTSLPTDGTQVIGRVLSTTGGAGTYNVLLFGSEVHPAATFGSGTTNYVALWSSPTTLTTATDFFRDAATDPANPEYVLGDNLNIYTTNPISALKIDTDQIILSGSATRTVGTVMQTMKAVSSQTGNFQTFTDVVGTTVFAVDVQGDVKPRGLNYTWPSAFPGSTQCLAISATGVMTFTACSGSAALTATYIGFGSGGGLLTGSSSLTWNDTTKTVTQTAVAAGYYDLVTGSTASAIRMPAGAAPASHPGSGGGIIFPNVGGDQTSGPGIWWAGGAYNATSGLWLSLGLNWQGYGTAGSPFKVRKGTGTSSTGDLVFEVRPDDGQVNLYPFGTSSTQVTTVNFFELAANGTSRVELGGPDSLASTIRITLPGTLPGSTQCMQMSSTGVISVTGSTCGGGGSVTNVVQAYNVQIDGGCTGNGVTNDTACVAASYTAALAAGRPLYFPAGTYLVDAGTLILATNSVTIFGDGPGRSTIKNRTAGAAITLDNNAALTHSIAIRDLSLVGFGSGSSDVGLLVSGTGNEPYGLNVERVTIGNMAGRGIYVTSNLFTSRFVDIDVSVLAAGSNGIDISGGADITLENCYVHSVGTNGAAYRLHAGVTTLIACNGIDSGTNADWLVLGDSTGTGDPSDRYARVNLINCNIEAFTNRGVYAKSGSYVNKYEGVTFLAPSSGTVTPIKYDFVDTGQRGTMDAATSFTTQGASYTNSSAVNSNGAPFIQIGGTEFATYYDTNVGSAVTLPYATASLIPGSTNVALDISRGRIQALESSTLVGDLTGSNSFTGNPSRLVLQNGTDVRPTIAQSTSLATGIFFAATDQIGFTSNGSQKLLLTTTTHTLTGNLGINTSGSGSYALDIASGAVRVTNSNGSSTAVVEGKGNNNPYFLLTDTSASAIVGRMQTVSGAPDRLTIGSFSNHPFGLYTNSVERWTITTSGHFVPALATTYNIGSSSLPVNDLTLGGRLYWTGTTVFDLAGSGTPEGSVTASVGSVYRRTNGSAGATLYVKESGSGNTGWTALSAGGGGSQTPWTSNIDADGFNLLFDDGTGIKSSETSNPSLLLFTSVASAVNYFNITNSATGNPPIFEATGSDTNVGITFTPKGTGTVFVNQNGTTTVPALAVGATNIGFSNTGSALQFLYSGSAVAAAYANGLKTFDSGRLDWSSTSSISGTSDLTLSRFAVNVLRVGGDTPGSTAGKLFVSRSDKTMSGWLTVDGDTANTNAIATFGSFGLDSTGTAAAGLGGRLLLALESTTTNQTTAGAIDWAWNVATHASRNGYVSISAQGTSTLAEVARFQGLGSAVNRFDFFPSTTGNTIEMGAAGSDTDIGINLAPKGSGVVTVNTVPVLTETSINSVTNKTITDSSNVLGGVTMTLGSDANGDTYYRAGGVLTRLAKGTAGQCYVMNAGATAPEWSSSCGAGGGANTALSNLASVAINTTLVSDTDNTDDLGTTSIRWRRLHVVTGIYGTTSTPIVGTTSAGSAVNYLDVQNAATGSGPVLSALGSDSNVRLTLQSKGAEDVRAVYTDATTNTTDTVFSIVRNSSGTAANNIGAANNFYVQTSTTPTTLAGGIGVLWKNATHASRESRMFFNYVNASQTFTEALGLDANGARFPEISSAATPAANFVYLYAKDKAGVSNLYWKNDAGTEFDLSATGGSGLTVGTTTVTSGTGGRVFYETTGNVLGEISTLTSDGTIVTLAATVTTGTGATSGLNATANSLTTGNAFTFSSNSVTTGNVVSMASTSTAAGSNTQTVLNVATSGANGTSTQTTYGAQFSNTHTGTSSTNVGALFSASGGTTNNAIQVSAGVTLLPAGSSSALALAIGSQNEGFYSSSGVKLRAFGQDRWNAGTSAFSVFDAFSLGSGANVVTMRGIAANSLIFGGTADAASPGAQITGVQNVVAGTSNTAGANWTLTGSRGTGTGTGGAHIWQIAPAGSSGTSQNALVEAMRITGEGVIQYPTTITAGGTTGNQTIDKVSGTVNFAAAATSLTVTNNKVTANSTCFASVRTNDTTAYIKNVVPGAGSFVINLGAAATAETSVGFFCINP